MLDYFFFNFFSLRWAKVLTSSSHRAKVGQSWAVPAESGLQLKIHDPARYARGAPRHLQNHQKWFKQVLKNVEFSCCVCFCFVVAVVSRLGILCACPRAYVIPVHCVSSPWHIVRVPSRLRTCGVSPGHIVRVSPRLHNWG